MAEKSDLETAFPNPAPIDEAYETLRWFGLHPRAAELIQSQQGGRAANQDAQIAVAPDQREIADLAMRYPPVSPTMPGPNSNWEQVFPMTGAVPESPRSESPVGLKEKPNIEGKRLGAPQYPPLAPPRDLPFVPSQNIEDRRGQPEDPTWLMVKDLLPIGARWQDMMDIIRHPLTPPTSAREAMDRDRQSVERARAALSDPLAQEAGSLSLARRAGWLR